MILTVQGPALSSVDWMDGCGSQGDGEDDAKHERADHEGPTARPAEIVGDPGRSEGGENTDYIDLESALLAV